MAVITLSSPKGGAGKTTAATILATVLAERGAEVTIIDADPNKNVVDWRSCQCAFQLTVIGDVSEETIVDLIEEAAEKSSFVIVDLEGTASLMVIMRSQCRISCDPGAGSQLDAKQAARQMKLIKAQERIAGRSIPFAVLFTRTNRQSCRKRCASLKNGSLSSKCPCSRPSFMIAKLFAPYFPMVGRSPP